MFRETSRCNELCRFHFSRGHIRSPARMERNQKAAVSFLTHHDRSRHCLPPGSRSATDSRSFSLLIEIYKPASGWDATSGSASSLHVTMMIYTEATMVDQGHTSEKIAEAFGITVRQVTERLRHGRVRPAIRVAARNGEIMLDALKASAAHPCQETQKRVFDDRLCRARRCHRSQPARSAGSRPGCPDPVPLSARDFEL